MVLIELARGHFQSHVVLGERGGRGFLWLLDTLHFNPSALPWPRISCKRPGVPGHKAEATRCSEPPRNTRQRPITGITESLTVPWLAAAGLVTT
jgi:hypothetical protein